MISETFNMDCMEYMSGLPDNAFSLAICDPEYGNSTDAVNLVDCVSKGKQATLRTQYQSAEWNASPPPPEYFVELQRVSHHQIIWGGNFFGLKGGYICWNKNGTAFGECELAYCSKINSVRLFEYTWNGMIQGNMKNKEKRIHNCQKPVALYKWLLQNYAKEGDKIFDSHLGSGSSRIACYDLGFDFVGTELDKDYFEAQEKRFANHIQQPSLLEPEKRVEVQGSMFA